MKKTSHLLKLAGQLENKYSQSAFNIMTVLENLKSQAKIMKDIATEHLAKDAKQNAYQVMNFVSDLIVRVVGGKTQSQELKKIIPAINNLPLDAEFKSKLISNINQLP